MTPGDANESTQLKQRVTTIVLAVLAVVFVILRLTARQMKRMAWGWDDYTLIAGLVSLLSPQF
jgi:succinate dehydrogenase hydrophobic anchor subunit